MWIDYLKLKNFRQYQDETIKFANPLDGKNFTILKGTNGAGKTNILNAITWCLYGDEYHLGIKNRKYKKINTLTQHELKHGEISKVEVEIQFKDENDRIVVTRTTNFKKTEDGKIVELSNSCKDPDASDNSSVRIMRYVEGHGMVDGGTLAIETLIPSALKEYFFFDGEHLDEYFRETSAKSIKDAVFKISQIETLDNTINNIDRVRSELYRKSKKISADVSNKEEEVRIHKTDLEEYKKETEEFKEKFEGAQKREKEYREKLRGLDAEGVSRLEAKRENIEDELNEFETKLRKKQNDKWEFLIKVAPRLFSYDAISKTRYIYSDKEDSGELPADHKRNFLEKLLSNRKCICGSDLHNGTKYRAHVLEAFEKCSEITDITDELSDLSATLRGLERELKDFSRRMKEFNDDIDDFQTQIKKCSDENKGIGLKIAGIDVEKVKRWELKRKEYEALEKEFSDEIIRRKTKIEIENKLIERLEKELEDELKKENKGKEFTIRLDFCKKALLVAQNIKEEIMESMRRDIEKKTNEQFLQLIWKKKNFTKVIIDNEYNISVKDQGDEDVSGALAAGERQALALSFMAALNSVSGFKVPVVIDTPLGRIDEGEPRKQMSKNLPNYLKGKQVIMLVTGSEYTDEVKRGLSKCMGKEYEILFEESDYGNKAKVVLNE